ncbi:MAG: hypothetical protein GY943_31700 [Chloroflexi bacterium]|nr:hypothetical protein [Chloroflexota bacterium]
MHKTAVFCQNTTIIKPRWRIVLKDLVGNRTRTVLVVGIGDFENIRVDIAFADAPLSHAFSIFGVLLWLVIVIILSAIASYMPARNASRLTVREVLAYE